MVSLRPCTLLYHERLMEYTDYPGRHFPPVVECRRDYMSMSQWTGSQLSRRMQDQYAEENNPSPRGTGGTGAIKPWEPYPCNIPINNPPSFYALKQPSGANSYFEPPGQPAQ